MAKEIKEFQVQIPNMLPSNIQYILVCVMLLNVKESSHLQKYDVINMPLVEQKKNADPLFDIDYG